MNYVAIMQDWFTKNRLLFNPVFIASIFVVIVLILSTQSFLLPLKTFEFNGVAYTHYNNYIIFKQSFFHLIQNVDLYLLYPTQHWDYFKYSPTFALAMAAVAILPNFLGLVIWNLINVLVLLFAFYKLPNFTDIKKLFAIAFILLELITSTQNAQSNALIAGLLILAFICLEKRQVALASLLIVSTIFIKLFGLVALAIFILYPSKKKAAFYTIGWTLLFTFVPLLVISPTQLILLYKSWFNLLQNDHSSSIGISVSGWLYSWFGITDKKINLVIGILIFCLPFLRYKYFNQYNFRLFFLSSILLWVILFNHKAESATYIIAISGVAIWFWGQKLTLENSLLVLLVFIFSILSPTDIFPKVIRQNYVLPYVLKAVPCILVWLKISYDLFFYKPQKYNSINLLQDGAQTL